MKIYIAGKITGDPNYREKFAAAEETLRDKGNIVLNPAALPAGLKNQDYMSICKAMIDAADMVALLSDYEKSQGAKMEVQYAQYTNKLVSLIPIEQEIEIRDGNQTEPAYEG